MAVKGYRYPLRQCVCATTGFHKYPCLWGFFTHSLSECDPSTSLRFEHTRGRFYSAKTRHQTFIKHSRHKSGKSSGTQRFLEVILHPPFREVMACNLYTTSDNYAWACTKYSKDHLGSTPIRLSMKQTVQGTHGFCSLGPSLVSCTGPSRVS